MAKKKKKKGSKGIQSQLHHLSWDQLLERGERFLEAGKARDAISVLKFAAKRHGLTDEIRPLLFRSYLQRERALREKSMFNEADTLKKSVREYMPKLSQISAQDLALYLSTCSNQEAFDLYGRYAAKMEVPAPAVERFLAGRLLLHETWEMLSCLGPELPVVKDADTAQAALSLMNAAEWEKAADALRGLPRSSPYAPVRMFCRGMAEFYAGNDAAAAKAFSMIPEDFYLKDLASDLEKMLLAEEKKNQKDLMRRYPQLWDGPIDIKTRMAELIRDLEAGRTKAAEEKISAISEAIFPNDPKKTRVYILQILRSMVVQGKMGEREYDRLVKNLLPPEDKDLLFARIQMAEHGPGPSSVVSYLRLLEKDFTDPEERKMAHAFVLQFVVDLMDKERLNPASGPNRKAIRENRKLLGTEGDKPEMIPIEMLAKAIELDPKNRSAYELLVRLPKSSRPATQLTEKLLLDMADCFPDDPYPCLELATLYYRKNAFRKAENILETAMKRAPHDNRVIERHGLAFLISAQKNMDRDKYHLVEKDLDRAQAVEAKRIGPMVAEKRAMLSLIQEEAPDPVMDRVIDDRPLFEKLRILALLLSELNPTGPGRKPDMIKTIEKRFQKVLKQSSQLQSSEIVRLLRPLEERFSMIYPTLNLSPIFLKYKKNLIGRVDDEEILFLYDAILTKDLIPTLRKDIRSRLKSAKPDHQLLLSFVLLVIDSISGKKDVDSEDFKEITDNAKGQLSETLRMLARRLAPHAEGHLKKALELFDFSLLDASPFGGFPPLPFDDDFDPFDLFDDLGVFDDLDEEDEFQDDMTGVYDERFGDILNRLRMGEVGPGLFLPEAEKKRLLREFTAIFEDFIDSIGLRGMPESLIKKLRGLIREQEGMRHDFDFVARLLEENRMLRKLSREARIILYGKK